MHGLLADKARPQQHRCSSGGASNTNVLPEVQSHCTLEARGPAQEIAFLVFSVYAYMSQPAGWLQVSLDLRQRALCILGTCHMHACTVKRMLQLSDLPSPHTKSAWMHSTQAGKRASMAAGLHADAHRHIHPYACKLVELPVNVTSNARAEKHSHNIVHQAINTDLHANSKLIRSACAGLLDVQGQVTSTQGSKGSTHQSAWSHAQALHSRTSVIESGFKVINTRETANSHDRHAHAANE